MPGHGDPIVQTFNDWMIRTGKRISRLERRLAIVPSLGAGAGTVVLWAGQDVPPGWVACEGQQVQAGEVPALARTLGQDGPLVLVPALVAPTGLRYIIKT